MHIVFQLTHLHSLMSLEKLDLSVALKLAFVEDSLGKVEEYRTQLHQNAQKVDVAVHFFIS